MIRRHFETLLKGNRRSKAQGLVEFALILPVMLILIFVIVELARVLHAWLAIENGARFGVRYAVTGEWNSANCFLIFGVDCASESDEDAARIPSIRDAARAGAVAILRDDTALTINDPGFFKVTVCSEPNADYTAGDTNIPSASSCAPDDNAGDPGDTGIRAVDFN